MGEIVKLRRSNGKSAPSRFVPDDFELSDDLIAWTQKICPQMHIDSEFDTFRDYEFRRNYTDWVRVWRNWVRNYIKFNSNSRNPELYVGMQRNVVKSICRACNGTGRTMQVDSIVADTTNYIGRFPVTEENKEQFQDRAKYIVNVIDCGCNE